ncbi:hypothetical protein K469DRAFT_697353 [Zopfia rhizophila CBS 207.26]|uniref:Transposase Tc1-like domain-containing protein n=1 Tax=Zopfia rhizophila CBS 207.26 TaxID=1314779 RepID=A0A6A6DCN4_9PEZI|nr:hypothetical protein K469DRAFT_697353 [Zopfia rhizophila CBS 207.26]
MPNKTSRKELSESAVNTIWQFHLYMITGGKIAKHLGLARSTFNAVIRRLRKQPPPVYVKALRTGRPPRLDERAERHLIRYVGQNPFQTIETLSTPSKAGCRIHVNTTRNYLAKNEIYAFRPRRTSTAWPRL